MVSVVSVVLTGWLVFVDQGASVVMAGGDIICGNAKVRVFVFCFLGGADTETEMRTVECVHTNPLACEVRETHGSDD